MHISHPWGGGLAQWIDDFASADKGTRQYILKSIGDWDAHGKSLALYEHPDGGDPLGWWTLARPILSTTRHHHEYRAILQDIIDDYAIDTIIASTVIGHSLDALRTDLPTLVVCHDFYPACPVLYASFGGPCESCEAPRLTRCLTENPEHRYFRAEPADNWLQMRSEYARLLRERDLPVVAPGNAVGRRMALIAPELAKQQITVVPHGLPPSLAASLREMRPSRPPQEQLRVLVPGSLQAHKGLDILRELIGDPRVNVHFHLLGCGDDGREFEGQEGVTITERYARKELASHLAEISPDLGLLLSTVPETFSYTLAELQAARVPVIATNMGAFAERVRDGHTGWLVPPNVGEVVQTLSQLAENRAALEQARENLADTVIATTLDTVARYRTLLGDVRKTAQLRPPYLRKRSPLTGG
jgi:glycosyltransferase involved in cell wall biosynthesis